MHKRAKLIFMPKRAELKKELVSNMYWKNLKKVNELLQRGFTFEKHRRRLIRQYFLPKDFHNS